MSLEASISFRITIADGTMHTYAIVANHEEISLFRMDKGNPNPPEYIKRIFELTVEAYLENKHLINPRTTEEFVKIIYQIFKEYLQEHYSKIDIKA